MYLNHKVKLSHPSLLQAVKRELKMIKYIILSKYIQNEKIFKQVCFFTGNTKRL
jgi:hypothetical protein